MFLVGWVHQQYGNLVSGFCRFSPFSGFPETWKPGKGIDTKISKGSSKGRTSLGLTR
jgi:hypothetical protein